MLSICRLCVACNSHKRHRFKVRGPNYLVDGKKIPSAEPAFELKGVEIVTTLAADVLHISPYLPLVMHSSDPFVMPVHFKMPYAGECAPTLAAFPAAASADSHACCHQSSLFKVE